jgi:hypothetical protein
MAGAGVAVRPRVGPVCGTVRCDRPLGLAGLEDAGRRDENGMMVNPRRSQRLGVTRPLQQPSVLLIVRAHGVPAVGAGQ